MGKYYLFALAVWLEVKLPKPSRRWLKDLEEHLFDEFTVSRFKRLDQEASAPQDGKQVSFQIQESFNEDEVEEDEPTEDAIFRLSQQLREHLQSHYEVISLEIMDDSPNSYLLEIGDDEE